MSRKHESKHCHLGCDGYRLGVPLYRINVGNLETEQFRFGLPLAIRMEEAHAIKMMAAIDDYIDAYITSCIDDGVHCK